MTTTKPSSSFWIISVLSFIWNVIGVLIYMATAFIDSETLATLPAKQAELIQNTPQWLTGIFAISTITAVLGSVLLLLLRKAATSLFFISLIGVIVQMGYTLLATEALEIYGILQGIIMPLFISVIAAYLFFFSKKSVAKGYLK